MEPLVSMNYCSLAIVWKLLETKCSKDWKVLKHCKYNHLGVLISSFPIFLSNILFALKTLLLD